MRHVFGSLLTDVTLNRVRWIDLQTNISFKALKGQTGWILLEDFKMMVSGAQRRTAVHDLCGFGSRRWEQKYIRILSYM